MKRWNRLVSGVLTPVVALSLVATPGIGGFRAQAEDANYLSNGDMESGSLDPWTVANKSRDGVSAEVNNWSKQNGAYGIALKDDTAWVDGDAGGTVDLTQTIAKLPAGTYTLTVSAMGNGGQGLTLIQDGQAVGQMKENPSNAWGTWDVYTFDNIVVSGDKENYSIGVRASLWAGGNAYCIDDVSLVPAAAAQEQDVYLDVYSEDFGSASEAAGWNTTWSETSDGVTAGVKDSEWKFWSPGAQDVELSRTFEGLSDGEYRFSLVAVGGDCETATVGLDSDVTNLTVNPWGGTTETVTALNEVTDGKLTVTIKLSLKDGGWVNLDDLKLQKKSGEEEATEAEKQKLTDLVRSCNVLEQSWYSDRTWSVFSEALEDARTTLEDSLQVLEDLQEKYNALKNAKRKLAEASVYVNKVENLSEDFIRGVDISSIASIYDSGAAVRNMDGEEVNEADFFVLLKESGVNWVRLRIWNDPYEHDASGNAKGYGGGNNDLEKAIEMGKMATDAGLKVLIDFHYSDFWADPGKQLAPKDWRGYTVDETAAAVNSFTMDSLKTLIDEGVDVCMVQVGNETNNGIAGVSAGSDGWAAMCKVFSAGSLAVRSVAANEEYKDKLGHDIQVAVHFTDPQTPGNMMELAGHLDDYQVDYDVFASSYYPASHGTMENITAVLGEVASRYRKKVMVAETSWAWTNDDGDGNAATFNPGTYTDYPISVQGQATELRDVVEAVNNVNQIEKDAGLGVFYWEPAWIPVQYAYDEEGKLVQSIYESNRVQWEENGSGVCSTYALSYDKDEFDWAGGSVKDNEAFFDFEGYPLASLTVYKDVYTGSAAPYKKVEVLKNASVEYETPNPVLEDNLEAVVKALPATVTGVYNDSSTKAFPVVWNTDEIKEIRAFGNYTISGTVTYSTSEYGDQYNAVMTGAEVAKTVSCALGVFPHSILKNGDFENDDDGSWTVANANGVEIKWNDTPIRGNGALHFWSGAAFDFTVSQKVKAEVAGSYCASMQVQGAESDSSDVICITVTNNTKKTSKTADARMKGWTVWQNPSTAAVDASKGDELEVVIRVKCAAGEWGSIDDVFLYNTESHVHVLTKVPAKAATLTAEGNKEYWVCSGCNKIFLDAAGTKETTLAAVTIAKLCAKGHTLVKVAAKAATTTAAGNKEYWKCSVCGKLYSDSKGTKETTLAAVTIAKLSAAKKGASLTYAKFTYKVTVSDVKKGAVSLTGAKSTFSGAATIPATIKVNGITYKVTAIADKAFKGNKKVTSVTIGKNVASIGKNAFDGCTKLTKVKAGAAVKSIGASAFSGCTKLATVTLGSAVTSIGSSAFKKCSVLKSLTIPAKVKTIGASAFSGAKKLTKITVKSAVLTKKGVKNSLKDSSVKKVKLSGSSAQKKLSTYKKYFAKSNSGKSVTVSK